MPAALIKACSAALLASAASAVADSATPVRDGCNKLLKDVAARGYTDMELAAYCRATLPPDVCRDAVTTLGSQPWAPERVGAACQKWEDDARGAPGRETATSYENYLALQKRVDETMAAKAEVGLCKDPNSGSAISLDQCVEWKLQEYPKYSARVQEAVQKVFSTAVYGQGVPMAAKFEIIAPAPARGASLAAVLAGLAGLAVLAAVAVVAGRRVKSPEQNRALVQVEDDA
mmetsp:Transcript_30441/g.70786  ORF Transcript_30441/g.70786 Transcript_30441/m.70786 type:complete len:231 (-) Transcript_30441:103-795(-)|eukprot:CAMPEP_0171109076 /NCGR_PEP_ID=MMETSP0766_2-20121228/70227_1 /TAXON_ID=439317 /ORGANISM="Gambierdiscus australes, Strain CAWD 149" /LENGTH=230 /DNA_ID=CAMNT_0011570739 /DNA_START=58 /DNA_END=750 /DNA_ORIENTATION=+